jgi:hypothetical protein
VRCSAQELDSLKVLLASEEPDEVVMTLQKVLCICRLKENILLFVNCDGLVPLIKLLERKENSTLSLATKAIFYIVQMERARPIALSYGVLVPLFSLLMCTDKNVVQNTVSSISELAGYVETRRMILSSPDNLQLLIAQLRSEITQTQYVTACTISNLALAGDKEFNTFMIEQGVLVPLFSLMSSSDADVLYATLCAMWNLEAQNRKYVRFVLLKLQEIVDVLYQPNDKVKDVGLEILEGYLEHKDLTKGMDFMLQLINTGITWILYADPTFNNNIKRDNVLKINYIKSKLERMARRVTCFLELITDEIMRFNCAIALCFIIRHNEDKIYAFLKKDWLSVILDAIRNKTFRHKAVVALSHLLEGIPLLVSKPPAAAKLTPSEEFLSGLNNKNVSDVVFSIDGKLIYASKIILTSRSEYFRTLLLGGMAESAQTEITMEGVDYDIFMKIIKYLYTYNIMIETDSEGIQLLIAADQYQLNDFKWYCEQELSQYISGANIELLYETAVELRATNLEQACLKWMLENMQVHGFKIPENIDKFSFVQSAKQVIRSSMEAHLLSQSKS